MGHAGQELADLGIRRHVVDSRLGVPDRVDMRDVEPGETVLLLNYVHQPAETPYRASHPIFVREGAERRFDAIDQVPEVIRRRAISLRAFNNAGEMVDADPVDGREIEPLIERFLANPEVSYLQAH